MLILIYEKLIKNHPSTRNKTKTKKKIQICVKTKKHFSNAVKTLNGKNIDFAINQNTVIYENTEKI